MDGTEIANCLEAASSTSIIRHDGQPQPRRVAIHSDGQDSPTPLPEPPPRSPLRPSLGRRGYRARSTHIPERSRLSAGGSSHLLLSHLAAMMTTLTPDSDSVPVLRTPSFSSLSQLLEALGSTPDLQSVLGAVDDDDFEDDFDREREEDHFNDTLAAELASSYSGATDSHSHSVDTLSNHTPALEFTRDKELPPPPSTLPLSLPVKATHQTLAPAMSRQENLHQDSQPSSTPALTKRRHALLELLTSERAYASDLALIRDVYMRLASGESHSLFPF